MSHGGQPRTLTLVRPSERCAHAEVRSLVWACTLPAHGPEVAHVLRVTQ